MINLTPAHHFDILLAFCESLHINIPPSTLKKDLLEHPHYPSLLSFCDVLKFYDIDNIVIPAQYEKLEQLPTPFMALIKDKKTGDDNLTLISTVTDHTVKLRRPGNSKPEYLSTGEFRQLYNGLVLLANRNNQQQVTGNNKLRNLLLISAIPLLVFIQLFCSIVVFNQPLAITPILLTILTLAGCLVTTLLLLHETDADNSLIRKFCPTTTRTDCSAVLHSQAARIVGLNWSVIGAAYFFGTLILLSTQGIFNQSLLNILGLLTLLPLPYTVYSVYYQWRIAKKWCMLCLAVQGILLLQFIVTWKGGFLHVPTVVQISYQLYLSILSVFGLTLFAIDRITALATALQQHREKAYSLQRFKNNTDLFENVLKNQKKAADIPADLGLVLGNRQATNNLLVVSNPNCYACSKTHPQLINLLKTNDIKIQIIFSLPPAAEEARVVEHFFYVRDNYDEASLIKALNDWFSHSGISEELYNNHHHLAEDYYATCQQNITSMRAWCEHMQIASTPSYFFNGFELPAVYSVADIKYFLRPIFHH